MTRWSDVYDGDDDEDGDDDGDGDGDDDVDDYNDWVRWRGGLDPVWSIRVY